MIKSVLETYLSFIDKNDQRQLVEILVLDILITKLKYVSKTIFIIKPPLESSYQLQICQTFL